MKHPLESLKARLATGSMSRRQFMRSVVATGISAAAASSVADQVMAAAPKRGGTIRIGKGHGQTTDTMNPAPPKMAIWSTCYRVSTAI